MISLNAGDVIDFPIIERDSQGELTNNSKVRPAVIIHTYPEYNNMALAMKITTTGIHPKYNRIIIKRWARAGLDEQSYAEIDTVDVVKSEMAVRPRGCLHFSDFKRILDEFNKFYGNT